MHEVHEFGLIVLLVSTGFALAVVSSRLSERLRDSRAGDLPDRRGAALGRLPLARRHLDRTVERIGVVALTVILFDGGTRIGLRRLRTVAVPVLSLGILGTFATAGLVTLAAHWLLDFSWITSGLIGAAIAPTDPAVMFSVLGRREVSGRTGTILEAESGANDPVGIALMIGMIEFATSRDGTLWTVVREFALEMSIGLAVGVAGAYVLLTPCGGFRCPWRGCIRCARSPPPGVIYGVASILHGSGFLAVFVAGILVGDERAAVQGRDRAFFTSLASLAEIVMFVALGLTIHVTDLPWTSGATALVLAIVVALVARPLVVGVLLLPAGLRVGERLFVMWGGLKGAVPIFLAAFAILAGVDERGPDLRHRLRGRRAFGGRSGLDDPARRLARGRADAARPARAAERPSVRVEALAGLAAELSFALHLDETLRRRHPRLAELRVQRLRCVHVHVDADEVDERARPHRPAGAVGHRRVEILGRDSAFVEDADAVVQQRDQDPVDDEARRVVAVHRPLARLLRPLVSDPYGIVARTARADDLDERQHGRRVEEVHADDALRMLRRLRDVGDGESRRVRREDGVRAA